MTDLGGETFIGMSGTAPVLRPIVQDYVHGSHAEVVPVGEADYLEMAARVSKKSRESLSAWIHCSSPGGISGVDRLCLLVMHPSYARDRVMGG